MRRVMAVSLGLSVTIMIGAASSAFAQAPNPAHAPALAAADVNAIKMAHRKFVEAWDRHDAAAMASVFDPDGVVVFHDGLEVSRQGIAQHFKRRFTQFPATTGLDQPIDTLQVLSPNTILVAGHWTMRSPQWQGYWAEVYDRADGDWRMRLHTYSFASPPVSPKARN